MAMDNDNLAEAREQKRVGKRVSGWFWVAFAGAMLLGIGMILPALNHTGRHKNYSRCSGNLKQLGLALIIYAGDDVENGYFPSGETFELLHRGSYLQNGKVYSCDRAEHRNELASKSNYVYLGRGLKDTNASPTTLILAHDRIGNHQNWVNCLYLDGHVRGYKSSARTWQEFRAEREAAGDLFGNEPGDDGLALGPEDAATIR